MRASRRMEPRGGHEVDRAFARGLKLLRIAEALFRRSRTTLIVRG